MKANELRIGNYLFNENSEAKQVVKIGFTRVWIGKINDYWDAVDYGDTSSIPLTEEWLLKFGFEEEGESFNLNDFSIELIGDDGRWCTYFFDTYHSVECSLSLIKYVHQLQNLYFALTGEELILN